MRTVDRASSAKSAALAMPSGSAPEDATGSRKGRRKEPTQAEPR